jgi:hypothetical protein
MVEKVTETKGVTHYTCTSTPLSDMPGSRPERVARDVVDNFYLKTHGHQVSEVPAVAIIQREQAIRASKRKR